MRIYALIVAVAAGTHLVAMASEQDSGDRPTQQAAHKPADKIKELQQERLTTLKAIAEMETALYRVGKASPEAVMEANVLVCEAELDGAEKDSERIAIMENLVKVLGDLEETAKARKQSAEGTETAVLKIKARRLEAKIRLERARLRLVDAEREGKR